MKGIRVLLLILVLCLGLAQTVRATTIRYDINDLGSGVWQYSYWVEDYTFDSDYGFTVYFDYGLYENITPISDSFDWDEISWDPDPMFGPGAYDALAFTDNATLSSPFTVSFNWLGNGSPLGYAQDYEIYYLPYSDPIQIIEEGRTDPYSNPVPEPATIMLLGSGLLGLVRFCKKLKVRQQ